jgi:hypothetical protein
VTVVCVCVVLVVWLPTVLLWLVVVTLVVVPSVDVELCQEEWLDHDVVGEDLGAEACVALAVECAGAAATSVA